MYASVHGLSTKNGLFVLLDWTTGPWPSVQWPPKSTDLYTSVCSMFWSNVNPFRLPWYTAPDASTLTEVSPLWLSAYAPCVQVLPLSPERKNVGPEVLSLFGSPLAG